VRSLIIARDACGEMDAELRLVIPSAAVLRMLRLMGLDGDRAAVVLVGFGAHALGRRGVPRVRVGADARSAGRSVWPKKNQ
jgi:hypothetical protein